MSDTLADLIGNIGRHLGFEVATEVEASESAWIDVVWSIDASPLRPLVFGSRACAITQCCRFG